MESTFLTIRNVQPESRPVSQASSISRDGQTPEEVFSGGGELGDRIRAFDWSSTPMGPISGWPQSLKTAVRILITSRYSMWMGWGPDSLLYNDAYARQTLGKKHPWALGKPAREVWAEIWADLDPARTCGDWKRARPRGTKRCSCSWSAAATRRKPTTLSPTAHSPATMAR